MRTKIAIFGKVLSKSFHTSCVDLFSILKKFEVDVVIYKPFYEFLLSEVKMKPDVVGFFEGETRLEDVDLVFSIGGDGTFLESVSYVRDSGIPIVGINTGRLGFLADISQNDMRKVVSDILTGTYKCREIELLSLYTGGDEFGYRNFALNELAISKRDSSAMISIHTYLNDEFLTSYWADGLIIATPTGSTAYSMSVGGPIVHPLSQSFIITPIAPHNLTVRPMVVPNDVEITLKIDGRDSNFLASLDSRSVVFENTVSIRVKKADFKIRVVELPDHSFYSTLRNKLMWGADRRN